RVSATPDKGLKALRHSVSSAASGPLSLPPSTGLPELPSQVLLTPVSLRGCRCVPAPRSPAWNATGPRLEPNTSAFPANVPRAVEVPATAKGPGSFAGTVRRLPPTGPVLRWLVPAPGTGRNRDPPGVDARVAGSGDRQPLAAGGAFARTAPFGVGWRPAPTPPDSRGRRRRPPNRPTTPPSRGR